MYGEIEDAGCVLASGWKFKKFQFNLGVCTFQCNLSEAFHWGKVWIMSQGSLMTYVLFKHVKGQNYLKLG